MKETKETIDFDTLEGTLEDLVTDLYAASETLNAFIQCIVSGVVKVEDMTNGLCGVRTSIDKAAEDANDTIDKLFKYASRVDEIKDIAELL